MIVDNAMANLSAEIGRLIRGNSMIRVIVCDDDETILKTIHREIEYIFCSLGIKTKIHLFETPMHISDQILSSCDIALLDIDFATSEYNGIDFARKLRSLRKDAIIIFVTNFIEYAPEGYEVQAFRYVLKKNLTNDLSTYINQALNQLQAARETLKIQVNGEIIDLLLDSILYFEVCQHNVSVHILRDNPKRDIKTYTFYASLSDLENQLSQRGFLRIHKSYLVNMKHLKRFQCREALLDNGFTLRVSEKSYAENKKKYLLWKGWK